MNQPINLRGKSFISLFLSILLSGGVTVAVATNSTALGPMSEFVSYGYKAYVDTAHCTQPISSSPYVIVAGIGGGNHELSCPQSHPVMYKWRQTLGFGSTLFLPAIVAGGGKSWITCCQIKQKFEKVEA